MIVPDGVLFGSSNAHKSLRKMIVEDHKLEGIVSMPSGVFKPYAGVSTAILYFTKTNSGGTDHVWFYDMQSDGFSLDDKRTPQIEKNDIPEIQKRWKAFHSKGATRNQELERKRTESSFCVPLSEIQKNEYDLSINRYKEVEYAEVKYDSPKIILKRLVKLEEDILKGQKDLERLLN